MWGRELGRLLLAGLLAAACNCSKADDAQKKAPKAKPSPTLRAPRPATDSDIAPPNPDEVRDLMDDGEEDDAGVLNISHGTSGVVARVPGDCEPTIHTELERRLDCDGWTIQLSWIAAQAAPEDLVAAAAAALPNAKRRIISKTPVKSGVVLLTDRPDGSRAYEGWFHRAGKLIYLQARAPRAGFKPISGKLQAVATDFVTRNLSRKKR